jgi:hypothetical protein
MAVESKDLTYPGILAVLSSLIVCLCCLLPALLLFFLGYVPRQTWNEDAITATCIVTAHDVNYATCREKHNQKLHYTCYQGYITLELNLTYFDEDLMNTTYLIYVKEFKVKTKRNKADVTNFLRKEYALYSEKTCYYQEDDPEAMKLKKFHGKDEPGLFLGFFIVFLIFGVCVFGIAFFLSKT